MAVQHPFQTPQEQRSFSALVDQVVLETGKTQALRSVVQYANLSIRECQALVTSEKDLVEDRLTSDEDDVWIWDAVPARFRTMRAVLYVTSQIYPKLRRPGRNQENLTEFYYRSGQDFVFKGVIDGESVDVAYYMWAKPLIYYGRINTVTTSYPFAPQPDGYDVRPAYYDIVEETWYYLNDNEDDYVDDLGDDAAELSAREASSNWLVTEQYDMILEGTKAKVFKHFNDDRFSASFATYKAAQTFFRNTVGFEAETHEGVE